MIAEDKATTFGVSRSRSSTTNLLARLLFILAFLPYAGLASAQGNSQAQAQARVQANVQDSTADLFVSNNSGRATQVEISAGLQRVVVFQAPVVRTTIGRSDIVEVALLDERSLTLTGAQTGSDQLRVWLEGEAQPHVLEVRVLPTILGNIGDNYSVTLDPAGAVLEGEITTLTEHGALQLRLDERIVDAATQSLIQVQTDIRVVEVNKRLLESSGIFIGRNSPGSSSFGVGRTDSVLSFLSGNAVAPAAGEGGFSVIRSNTSGVLAALSALRVNGFASILAEPSVVSMSGQSAAFLVGGEFPVPVRSRDNETTIEYKEFGVRVQLTPTVLDENRIVLKVAPEVSELNFSNAIQSGGVAVPSLSVRRTDTTVQLGNGESFIISGLISNNTSQSTDSVPGLGDIPVLGALFRATRFDREERELIMIVTPHLVQPIAAGVDLGPMPGEALRRYKPRFLEIMMDPKSAEYIEKNTDVGLSGN